jgi:predicted SAM-dependent methyltransferase
MEEVKELAKVLKLDVACGNNKKEGFTGIDICKTEQADIVHDLNIYPWPFEDNSVDEVWCSHFIEHVADIMKFMNEVHRILKPGAQVTFISPYYSSVRCWQDPTHVRAISEQTYLYYNKGWREANKLEHYPITADFNITGWFHAWNASYASRSQDAKNFALQHYNNVVDDLWAVLVKI